MKALWISLLLLIGAAGTVGQREVFETWKPHNDHGHVSVMHGTSRMHWARVRNEVDAWFE